MHASYLTYGGELQVSSDREFERKVRPLLRVIAPTLVSSPALGSFDRIGADHVALNEDDTLSLVVQCKGFKAEEAELGESQVKQCKASIEAFAVSGRKAKCYLLVHNRIGKSVSFRSAIESKLEDLVKRGLTERAELWDRSKLLKMVAITIRDRLVTRLHELARSASNPGATSEHIAPLTEVPFKRARIEYSRHRLHETIQSPSELGDPVTAITTFGEDNLCILLGGAGFGKTTVMQRALETSGRTGFYFRAANLERNPIGTNQFIAQFVALQNFFPDFPAEDWTELERLARPMMNALLTDAKTPAFLVIDGLDESIFFSRRGGLQWLFNALLDIRVPVVLAARTEFWNEKLADFETSFGIQAQHCGTRQSRRTAALVELSPWTNSQIRAYATRYAAEQSSPDARARIDQFIQLVDADRYSDFYGDIPRRPLYLNYILETVAEHAVHAVNRRQLLIEWAELKIRRDVAAPMAGGNIGRAPITSENEGVAATLALSFQAMEEAASLMSQVADGTLELLPSCTERALREKVQPFQATTDLTGLILQSLLVPTPVIAGDAPRLRFAHQVHHELFLALHVQHNRDRYASVRLPDSVASLLVPANP